jgi:hypothetical protein
MRDIDIALLPLLRAAAQEDHQRLAVPPEIDAVARPEVDPVFQDTLADALHVGEIALLHPGDGARHLGAGDRL